MTYAGGVRKQLAPNVGTSTATPYRLDGCPAIMNNINARDHHDHLDRHGTFENYAAMKTRITARQTAEDFLVLNGEDKPTQMVAAKTKAQVYWFSTRRPVKQGAFVHGESV